MVVSVLAGGLGNQLFQYAFGLRVAQQLRTELRLERHLLENRRLAQLRQYTPRQYELDIFVPHLIRASYSDTLRCLGRILIPNKRSVLLRESGPDQLNDLSEQTKDALCFGYWQSEAYFKPIEEVLRQQLIFRKHPSDLTLTIADAILAHTNTTFIHIRRGDYVTNVAANQNHGLCDEQYYLRSVEYLHQRVADTHFFVFSDDQAWAKRTLGKFLIPATFVDHNTGPDSWQDMYLMSLCRHAIVANSSFSWWGAWLNSNKDRIVIAPKRWFADQPLLSRQIVLPDWHCL